MQIGKLCIFLVWCLFVTLFHCGVIQYAKEYERGVELDDFQ
jgi:hypothetical protein